MTVLTPLFQHHLWANITLIEGLKQIADEDLDRKTPGGFGTIRETLVHYVFNEGRFINVLNNGTTEFGDVPTETPSLEALRAEAEESNRRLVELAETVDEHTRVRGEWRGRAFDFPAYVPLLQAYHHAVEHRTNITTILRVYDLPVPNIDLWSYDAAMAAR
jgi:uncharacterized damage-inducible protein DinB